MKAVLALLSGSLAITASVIDSATDSVASLAVYGGLRLSVRKSPRFPLGLYKIENMASVAIALFVFLSGYEIARHVLRGPTDYPDISLATILFLLAGTIATFVFGQYVLVVGKQTESPTLIAEGRHRRVDVLSSSVVLASVLLTYLGFGIELFGITIDRIGAAVVLVFIVRAGWELLSDGMRVLLDASIDSETLDRIRKIIENEPAVTEVNSLIGRNAGRFRFIQATVGVRTDDLQKAYQISERLEANVRKQVPHVERVVIHYEPKPLEHLVVAVPLADDADTISHHFGEAPFFAIVHLRFSDKEIEKRELVKNPFVTLEKAKGIRVAEWLVEHKIDMLMAKEDMRHKGPSYVLADAGVKMEIVSVDRLNEAIDSILSKM
ncbi:MAG: cation diffusion facilitator family transporter [Candidatus Abyssobacteria bacterium SURF_17]|uniref:Cation diffusion facilitator family transporter n=1 Tax=Candidatus Abyssobacteria bacterium SURF_17 TaxID=2093361 RepID=A0A419F0C6_9BACT|nr:MAG: cation diffusion facilitator family transporter [Candidatus Abyssubacteria bacterium SURF_17]